MVLDQIQAAVTLLDLKGRILAYNAYAPTILDRRPEQLGRHINEYHQPDSQEKIDRILKAISSGREEPFHWQLQRDGQTFSVRVARFAVNGAPAGVLHTVMLLE